MSDICEVKPVSAFQSTNLNNKIETFNDLSDRITRSLGAPLITLEIHRDQLYQNIQLAVEYFTKYAGFTKEFLIFDSNLYEKNKGIRLDHLYTLAKTDLTNPEKIAKASRYTSPNYVVENPDTVYVSTTSLPNSFFSNSSSLSTLFTEGLYELEIIDNTLYNSLTTYNTSLTSSFKESRKKVQTLQGEPTTANQYSNVFDYDVMDYRKVISVTDFEEGSNTGINTLFTLEQTLAQQTYFSYALGNYGFDLVSWYSLKEWLETREKVLATRKDFKFDERTQYLQMYPQPGSSRFYGVISCYVERPIRDIIKEQWVYEYASALTKIIIGRVRGKFTNVNLLGGGVLNSAILDEGIREKKELEEKLLTGASAGFGDADPCLFFIG
jgi:hypothetical protein